MTPVDKQFNIVMAALTNNETIVPGPESCRDMLVALSPAALKIPKDERHAHQDKVIEMLRGVFDSEKARWEARVAEATSALEKATAECKEQIVLKGSVDA